MHGPVLRSDAHYNRANTAMHLGSCKRLTAWGCMQLPPFWARRRCFCAASVCSTHAHASNDTSAQTLAGAVPQTASNACSQGMIWPVERSLLHVPCHTCSLLARYHFFTGLRCRCVILRSVALHCIVCCCAVWCCAVLCSQTRKRSFILPTP